MPVKSISLRVGQTDVTASSSENSCKGVRDILSRVGDKWTIQVIVVLRSGPLRFNAIKRQVGGISHQMLTRTLKTLERDGMVERTVHHSAPPMVEYTLTPLGHSLSKTVWQLANWAKANHKLIAENRIIYDTHHQIE